LNVQAAADVVASSGGTRLLKAAFGGHTAVVDLLLYAGAAVNSADVGGCTALHYAAGNGHTAVLQLLLNAHADINSADAQGRTPVCHAAAGGHTRAVQLLLAVPQLATESTAGAARAAATAGHTELAIVVLKALLSRYISAAAAELADQTLAAEVLRLWQAADARV
jgi:ankyrin repeat protein